MNVEELSPEKITLETIMTNEMMDNSIHYCPSFAVGCKAGRPRKEKRMKGALECCGKCNKKEN